MKEIIQELDNKLDKIIKQSSNFSPNSKEYRDLLEQEIKLLKKKKEVYEKC